MRLERVKRWAWLAPPALVFFGAWLWSLHAEPPRREVRQQFPPPSVEPVAAAGEPAAVLAAAALPVRDPSPLDSHPGPVHPHPMTPARDRIQLENQLLGRLNDAVDLADPARLSAELAGYERAFPDDPNQLQRGYRVILECLENPGQRSTASALRYYDEERGSTLRRFVARHCLEQ